MRFKKGIIQLAVFLLLALSVIAIASVGVFAQQMARGRPLTNISAPRSSSISTANVRGPCYPIGDVNNDGVIKPDDSTTILNYVAGIKPTQFFPDRADVNKDGRIDAVDAQLLQQYLAGGISTFPACLPAINSVAPNPIPVGVSTVIATHIKVSGSGFGSTKGQVQFLFQPCSADTSPRCLAPDRIWNCDIGKSPAEWTNSKIVCAQPSGLPANQTLKLTVHTSDNRVSKPFSVRTLLPRLPSATPIISDDRCMVPPGIPLPSGCPTL